MSVCVRPSLSLVVDASVKRELAITMEVDDGSTPDEHAFRDQVFANMKDEVLDLHVKTDSAVQDEVPCSQQGTDQCYRDFEAFKQEFADVSGDLRDSHVKRGFDANAFVEKDLPLSNTCVDERVFKNVMVHQPQGLAPFKEDYANVNESVMDLHVNRSVAEEVFMNRVPGDGFQDHINNESITSATRDGVDFRENHIVDEAPNNEVLPTVPRNYWEVEGLGRGASLNQNINHANDYFMDVNQARQLQVDQNVVVVKQETQFRIQDAIQEIHKILMIQSKEVMQPNHIPVTYVFLLLLGNIILLLLVAFYCSSQ